MAKKQKTLDDLFADTLKDIFYAENKILKALPKVIEHAKHSELQKALTSHMEETKGHVARLEEAFGELDMKPASVRCEDEGSLTSISLATALTPRT